MNPKLTEADLRALALRVYGRGEGLALADDDLTAIEALSRDVALRARFRAAVAALAADPAFAARLREHAARPTAGEAELALELLCERLSDRQTSRDFVRASGIDPDALDAALARAIESARTEPGSGMLLALAGAWRRLSLAWLGASLRRTIELPAARLADGFKEWFEAFLASVAAPPARAHYGHLGAGESTAAPAVRVWSEAEQDFRGAGARAVVTASFRFAPAREGGAAILRGTVEFEGLEPAPFHGGLCIVTLLAEGFRQEFRGKLREIPLAKQREHPQRLGFPAALSDASYPGAREPLLRARFEAPLPGGLLPPERVQAIDESVLEFLLLPASSHPAAELGL